MGIYIISEIVLFFMAFLCHNKKVSFFVVCFILFFVTGMHNGQFLGIGDYRNYLDMFLGKNSMYGNLDSQFGYNLEMPYYYFCHFLRFFGQYDYVYIWGYALMIGIPFILLIKKYSQNYALSLFMLMTIMTSQMFVFYMHAHRQMIGSAFVMLAFLLFEKIRNNLYDNRRNMILGIGVIVFLWIAIMAHSSSYFIVPIFLLLCSLEGKQFYSRKGVMTILAISFFLGIILSSHMGTVMTSFMLSMDGVNAVERTSHYLIEETYGKAEKAGSIYQHALQTLTVLVLVFYAKEDEIHSIFWRCFIAGTVIYNLFSSVPLISRSVVLLILFGCVGVMPVITKEKAYAVMAIMLANAYICYSRCYTRPNFLLSWSFLWN